MKEIIKRKKVPEPQQHCEQCGHLRKQKDLYRFSWRYTDKTKVYAKSGRKWVCTGYKHVCKPCLDTLTI